MKFLINLIPIIVGFSVGFFTKPDKWYEKLKKPELITNEEIFIIIAWSILILFSGISYVILDSNIK